MDWNFGILKFFVFLYVSRVILDNLVKVFMFVFVFVNGIILFVLVFVVRIKDYVCKMLVVIFGA